MTRINVRGLKEIRKEVMAAGQEAWVWSDGLEAPQGFGVRAQPSGKVSFVFRYRVEGRRVQYKLGTFTGAASLQEAISKALVVGGDAEKGLDTKAKADQARRAITFSKLADLWIEDHVEKKRAPKTAKEARHYVDMVITPAFGTKKAKDVDRSDVARLHSGLAASPSVANKVLRFTSAILGHGERIGVREVGTNPCKLVPKFAEVQRERLMGPEELGAMGDALRQLVEEKKLLASAADLFRFLALTGCRLSEGTGLLWSDVDLDRRVITIRKHKSLAATGRAKILPLGDAVVELLEQVERDESSSVFPGCGPRASKKEAATTPPKILKHLPKPLVGVEKMWDRVRSRATEILVEAHRKAGLTMVKEPDMTDVRLHDLRHGVASAAAEEQYGLPAIGKLLGHTQASTTKRYTHFTESSTRKAANAVGNRLAPSLLRTKKA